MCLTDVKHMLVYMHTYRQSTHTRNTNKSLKIYYIKIIEELLKSLVKIRNVPCQPDSKRKLILKCMIFSGGKNHQDVNLEYQSARQDVPIDAIVT